MRRLGSVQQKIPCVFLTEVRNEPSRKRDCQVGELVRSAAFLLQYMLSYHQNPINIVNAL